MGFGESEVAAKVLRSTVAIKMLPVLRHLEGPLVCGGVSVLAADYGGERSFQQDVTRRSEKGWQIGSCYSPSSSPFAIFVTNGLNHACQGKNGPQIEVLCKVMQVSTGVAGQEH
eukprot:4327278-Amphidinium_carterae.1